MTTPTKKEAESNRAWMDALSKTPLNVASGITAISSYRAALKAEIGKRQAEYTGKVKTYDPESNEWRASENRLLELQIILDLIDTVVPEKHT